MKKDNVKIFDIDYLMSAELTDDDLHNLLDKRSLKYSLIIAEFKEAKYNMANKDIISACKNNKEWMYNYYWSYSQFNSFEQKLRKVYKNVYNYSNQQCISEAQWFIIMYGLTNVKQRKKQYILC